MKSRFFFFLAIFLVGLGLHLFPYNESKVARLRLESLWSQEKSLLQEAISQGCSEVTAKSDTFFSQLFLGWLSFDKAEQGIGSSCQLIVQTATSHRFFLQTNWVVHLHVEGDLGSELVSQTLHVSTPRPLVLLPIFVLILALLFNVQFWGLTWTVGAYLFLLSAGNLIQTFVLAFKTASLAIQADQTLLSFALITLWLSINKALCDKWPKGRMEHGRWNQIVNRAILSLIGLWKPILFTLLGRYFVIHKERRIVSFLYTQLILVCLSVYLLSFRFHSFQSALEDSLLLPRYFTFAVLIFFATDYWFGTRRGFHTFWHMPHMWRGVIAIILFEGLSYFYPWLRGFSLVTRVGMALILSELVFPWQTPWSSVVKIFVPWASFLFLSYFVTYLSLETGVLDLALVAMDPRKHPTFLTFWTFLAGASFGFITGSFSATYFTFLAFMKSPKVPLLNASLLDGILVGVLLSPFSLFNLLPLPQFKMKLRELLSYRLKQLTIPLLVGGGIYLVATLSTVAILRPVTFVFCCLLAFAIKLKESNWLIRRKTYLTRY